MFAEVNAAQKYIIGKFGDDPEPGVYAVPYTTARGEAFMRVVLDAALKMSGFELWWNPEFTISWYTKNQDGTPRSMTVDNA